jgi:UDPglucose--hexose-1-phosphate uridylyltransferase
MSKNKSEIRRSYLDNKYVIISPTRAKRPRDIKEKTIVSDNANCPFCPQNLDHGNIADTMKGDKKGHDIVSLHNIFPAVSLTNPNAYGVQEVIVDTPEHNKDLGELSVAQITALLKMYAKRTKELSQNKKIEYILCFKNEGSKAGASIAHAHSQIFATDILPPDIHQEIVLAQNYLAKHHECHFCHIIEKEMKTPRRIWQDKYVAAFAPYASEYHYEAWIFTKRHVDNIAKLNANELKSLATALKKILFKLHKLDLSYNFFLHQAVTCKDQHFYIKIQPRDSVWAGVELGSGLIINSVAPEDAAEYYRGK